MELGKIAKFTCLLLAFPMHLVYAANQDDSDIPLPHEISFSNGIVKYPLNATQETLEQYIPDLKCFNSGDGVFCESKEVDISAIFFRNLNCASDILFTLKNDKTQGVMCRTDNQETETIADKLVSKYGKPKFEQIKSFAMITSINTWDVGSEKYQLIHWGGNSANGSPINHYTVSVIQNN